MALGFGVGAEEPEAPFGEGTPRRPGLLAVQHPAPLALGPPGSAGDAGEVTAGVGLGPPLAPDLLSRRHRGQEAPLLLVGPELEQGGREQEDPVLAHPIGCPRPPVLLLEHQPLEEADPSPAVLLRPRDDRPALGGHGPLPLPVRLETGGRVEGREGSGGRGVLDQPRPGVGAECFLVVGVSKVHCSECGRGAAVPRNLTHRQISGNQGRSDTMESCQAP